MKGAPQLIIIDTLARHMGGLDENNAKDMVKLILMSTPDQNCTERRRESAPFGWIWPE